MANDKPTVEEMQKALDEQKKIIQEQDAAIKKAKSNGQKVSEPVEGSYTANWKTPTGEAMKKKIEFINGAINLRVPRLDGFGIQVGKILPSRAVFALANGKKVKEEDLATFPNLADISKEHAQAIITYFAQIGAACIK